MAPSDEPARARRAALGAMLALAAGIGVSGCSTTQQEAARLQLNSARIRAAEVRTIVRVPSSRVRVLGVTLVRGRRGDAFVVRVANRGPRAVADLPITVGIQAAGRRRVLNATSPLELSYYDAHLPALGAGGTVSWVFTIGHPLPRAARPFALVGERPAPAVRVARGPELAVRLLARLPAGRTAPGGDAVTESGPGDEALRISLHNPSSVPQYQLPVYALGRRAGRLVSAGVVTVAHLGSHASETVILPLLGPARGVSIALEAIPTIDR